MYVFTYGRRNIITTLCTFTLQLYLFRQFGGKGLPYAIGMYTLLYMYSIVCVMYMRTCMHLKTDYQVIKLSL